MIKNKNIIYYLIAMALFVLLKFGYTIADTNDLNFLLQPTNKLVEILTGLQSIYSIENGYYYAQLNIVINKSCSGFNFWLLCFLMLTFLSVNYFNKTIHKVSAFVFCFIAAYLLTIFVNSSRIFASIVLLNPSISTFHIKQPIIHESIGILTNLVFLILIYLIAEKILQKYQFN
ncbi:MAG: exosortase K [Chitinophagales bacterium]